MHGKYPPLFLVWRAPDNYVWPAGMITQRYEHHTIFYKTTWQTDKTNIITGDIYLDLFLLRKNTTTVYIHVWLLRVDLFIIHDWGGRICAGGNASIFSDQKWGTYWVYFLSHYYRGLLKIINFNTLYIRLSF